MTDKKSFVLYSDIIHSIEILTDDEAGKLFKHILRYVNDLNPTLDDRFLKVTFEPIKQNLKRDLDKYLKRVQTAKDNGLKGGRPKITKSVIPKPKKAVNVNDTVNAIAIVTDTDNVIDLPFKTERFANAWGLWSDYKKDQFKFVYKSKIAEQTALSKLKNLSKDNEETALKILEQSVANGWKGFFGLKEESKPKKSTQPSTDYLLKLKNRLNG